MKRTIAYWSSTALLAVGLLGSGTMKLTADPKLLEGITHLGYPPYLLTILGLWMVAGAVVLLAPGLPRLKEWAYAGVMFQMTGAFASHMFAGDAIGPSSPTLVLAALAVASYLLRPASRTLGAPWLGEGEGERGRRLPSGGAAQPA